MSKESSTIIIVVNVILAVTIVFSLANFVSMNYMFEEIEEEEVKIHHKMGYSVENLKGDKLSTYVGFKPRITYYFYIENAKQYPSEHIDAIKEAVLSTESVEIPNKMLHKYPVDGTSLYYKGLAGLTDKVREETDILEGKPVEFQFVDHIDAADVVITLTDLSNGEYSGWTTSTVDESTGTIQKSHTTIYKFNTLSKEDVLDITRHEMAHAVGLAHSTDPEDLMYPVIQTDFPYYSGCDLQARIALAAGQSHDDITCDW